MSSSVDKSESDSVSLRVGPARKSGGLAIGAAAGLAASIAGAAAWATVTVLTKFQIGWMAVGVGFLVGFAVGKVGRGTTTPYRVLGGGLALFGCLLGNFLSVVGFVSADRGASFFDILSQVDPSRIPSVMVDTASPMDILFYAIAVYQGVKFSVSSAPVDVGSLGA